MACTVYVCRQSEKKQDQFVGVRFYSFFYHSPNIEFYFSTITGIISINQNINVFYIITVFYN